MTRPQVVALILLTSAAVRTHAQRWHLFRGLSPATRRALLRDGLVRHVPPDPARGTFGYVEITDSGFAAVAAVRAVGFTRRGPRPPAD